MCQLSFWRTTGWPETRNTLTRSEGPRTVPTAGGAQGSQFAIQLKTYRCLLAGEEVASVNLQRIDMFLMEVFYVQRHNPGSFPVRCVVRLTSTKCNLGGERFWFRCPKCDMRTASIFLIGPPFKCRVCLSLTCQSKRERHPHRVLRRAGRLRKRLRGTGDAFSFGSKPQGMHRRTYERLVERIEKISGASSTAA
jgi:hypothetical protein